MKLGYQIPSVLSPERQNIFCWNFHESSKISCLLAKKHREHLLRDFYWPTPLVGEANFLQFQEFIDSDMFNMIICCYIGLVLAPPKRKTNPCDAWEHKWTTKHIPLCPNALRLKPTHFMLWQHFGSLSWILGLDRISLFWAFWTFQRIWKSSKWHTRTKWVSYWMQTQWKLYFYLQFDPDPLDCASPYYQALSAFN